MTARTKVLRHAYFDSVTLMQVSQEASALPGVREAVAVMGTPVNKDLLQRAGLLDEAARDAGESDLILAVAAEDEDALEAALARLEEALLRRAGAAGSGAGAGMAAPAPASAVPGAGPPRTLAAARRLRPDAQLAFISVPGRYAAREARRALQQGLHVMLFSDNVPLADEVALKRLAAERGLLLMGPDCGTAILAGVGLGFANAVRRGPIGIVAASGTGAQELSCLVHRLDSGVSHLIGTGGRDLSAEVGGLMARTALRWLAEDPDTQVIVLVSKPPAPAVAREVLAAAASCGKPAIACFMGPRPDGAGVQGVDVVDSIDAAAVRAVGLASGRPAGELAAALGYGLPLPRPAVAAGRKHVRGLFAGGTLCEQALAVLEQRLGPVRCNVHPIPERRAGAERSTGHTLLDLGDDAFTQGRAHPMIDPSLRVQRLWQEVEDPEVAVILLDVVLGHGAHPDPAGALAGAVAAAVERGIAVVASVTGTEADPQGRSRQERALREAGATVLPTARLAALCAAAVLGPSGAEEVARL